MNLLLDAFAKPAPGGEPVYVQIIRQFKMLVLMGRLKNGDEIPSRRMLAVQMGVNPMTVQKAFAELEVGGLIRTPPNAKSVVHVDEALLARLRGELLEGQVKSLVETAKGAGVECAELVNMIETEYGGRV